MRGFISTLALTGLVVSSVQAQQNFNVYGFMDMTFQQRFIEDENNLLQQNSFVSDKPTLTVDHLNLYFDFIPTERVRVLLETNLAFNPYDEAGSPSSSIGRPSAEKTGNKDIDEGIAKILAEVPNSDAGEEVEKKKYGGIKLERAWVDFMLMQGLTLKAGKFITPAGIWSVDHGSPIITTIRQPNQTNFFPIFPTTQTGLQLYGTKFVGDHDLGWNAYVSTGRDDAGSETTSSNAEVFVQGLSDYSFGGKIYMDLDVLDGTRVGASGYMGKIKKGHLNFALNPKISAENATEIVMVAGTAQALGAQAVALGNQAQDLKDDKDYLAALQAEVGAEIMSGNLAQEDAQQYITQAITDSATTLGTQAMQMGAQAQALGDSIGVLMESAMTDALGGTATNGGFNRMTYEDILTADATEWCVGAEFKTKVSDLTLQAEVNYRMIRNNEFSEISTEMLGWYLLASYGISLSENIVVSPYAMYETITWDHPESNKEAIGDLASIPANGWGTTWVGLNFSFFNNYKWKLEYSYANLFEENVIDRNGVLVVSPKGYGDNGMDIGTFASQISVAF